MFWGLRLESGKRYSQRVEVPFHVSMAVLECTKGAVTEDLLTVVLNSEEEEFVLCNLSKGTNQQTLDLNFGAGEDVTFMLTGGKGSVHLTGYLLPDDYDYDEEDDSMGEEEEEDEEAPSLLDDEAEEFSDTEDEIKQPVTVGKKRKQNEALVPMKKPRIEAGATKNGGKKAAEESDEDSSEDDDNLFESLMEGDSFDSDDDSDIEDTTPVKQKPKAQPDSEKKGKANQAAKAGANQVGATTPKQKPQQQGQQKSQQQNQQGQQQQKVNSNPNTPNSAEKKKKKKKKNKKNKNKGQEDGDTSLTSAGETPATTPRGTPNKETPKGTPKSANKDTTKTTPKGTPNRPQKKTLPGGLIVEDMSEGTGKAATPGKHVQLVYTGRLYNNNKVFDSTKPGETFKFKLGMNEVIKGWDTGIQGMKVGGKRKLIIPPKLGYGSQSVGPIPPNSTLVFDVEMKNIS